MLRKSRGARDIRTKVSLQYRVGGLGSAAPSVGSRSRGMPSRSLTGAFSQASKTNSAGSAWIRGVREVCFRER